MTEQRVVLLTEDNVIIGLDVCDALEAAGFRVVGPLTTGADAMTWIEREAPDLAVLDVMLKDGSSDELASELRRRSVPFIVHSGSHVNEPAGLPFADAPWIMKPASTRDLVATLSELSRGTVTP